MHLGAVSVDTHLAGLGRGRRLGPCDSAPAIEGWRFASGSQATPVNRLAGFAHSPSETTVEPAGTLPENPAPKREEAFKMRIERREPRRATRPGQSTTSLRPGGSRRVTCFPSFVLLWGFILCQAAGATSSAGPVADGVKALVAGTSNAIVRDAVGDPAPDLTLLRSDRAHGVTTFELGFQAASDLEGATGFLELDLDGSVATGIRSAVEFTTGVERGLGVDAYVDLSSWDSTTATLSLVDARDPSRSVLVTAAREGTLLRIEVADDEWTTITDVSVAEQKHVAAIVGGRSPTDIAPDGGYLATAITPSPDAVLVRGGRFAIEVDWRTVEGESGVGREVFSSSDSAVFWFFDEENWEMLVKVLGGCSFNDRVWVYAAATTDIGFTLAVSDLETGQVREYTSAVGQAAVAIQDTDAFTSCDS